MWKWIGGGFRSECPYSASIKEKFPLIRSWVAGNIFKPVGLGERDVAGPAVDRNKGIGIGTLSLNSPFQVVLAPLIFGRVAVGWNREEKVEANHNRVMSAPVRNPSRAYPESITEE